MGAPSRPGPPARAILHVDLDAFYAAVEVLADPSLAGKPVVVGGSGRRGVVAAASYEARVYGISSAMPSARARRLCPHAAFLPGRHDLYARTSRRFHEVLREVTPLVEGVALDEAFLDVTGARRLLGEPEEIARALRARIYDDLGLWASLGVAGTKMLAKLASEAAKPVVSADARAGPGPGLAGAVTPGPGVVVVAPGRELEFLHPLPVGSLWGVGPATARRLGRFGVATVGDLAALPLATLMGALGEASGRHLHELSWGRDPRPVEPDRPARSVGHEETYATDLHDRPALGREVVRLSDAVAGRLAAAGVGGRTVQLKVRFGDFRTISRSRTVPDPLSSGPEVARIAGELLAGVDPGPGIRLLGVSVSNLVPRPAVQLGLLEGGPSSRAAATRLGRTVGEVRRRFGEAALGPAALLEPDAGLRLRRRGDQQWGPDV